jgi:hypothetical protein
MNIFIASTNGKKFVQLVEFVIMGNAKVEEEKNKNMEIAGNIFRRI